MLRPMLPALCIPPLPPPADSWYVLGILLAAVLFAAASALLMLLRGWRWRSVAGAPLLAGIWCLLLAFWAQGHPRIFTFLCQQFPGQPRGGLIETSPPIVRATATIETVTSVLALAILLGALLMMKWCVRLRRSSPAA